METYLYGNIQLQDLEDLAEDGFTLLFLVRLLQEFAYGTGWQNISIARAAFDSLHPEVCPTGSRSHSLSYCNNSLCEDSLERNLVPVNYVRWKLAPGSVEGYFMTRFLRLGCECYQSLDLHFLVQNYPLQGPR